MTIRFAAARRNESAIVARVFNARLPLRPSNDNVQGLGGDELMGEALRHFARHGLCAAERARDAAEQAFFRNDRDGYQRWMGICRLLDRRMAEALAVRREPRAAD